MGVNTVKIALIIPIYHQSGYIPIIIKGIEKQSVKPDIVYVMLDRPTNAEQIYIEEEVKKSQLNIKIFEVTEPPKYIGNRDTKELFLTPHVRNMGVNEALKDNCNMFVFIDGDCMPQPTLIESHVNAGNGNVPVLSVGRRREKEFRWKDQREYKAEFLHLKLFRKGNFIVNSTELLRSSLVVWSCNIALNLKALKLIRDFNYRYYNRKEVFSGEFVGKWGGEDSFLGAQAWYCRIFIVMLGNESSGIEHIDHPRPENKYNINHMEFFLKQLEVLRRKMAINPLNMDFFAEY